MDVLMDKYKFVVIGKVWNWLQLILRRYSRKVLWLKAGTTNNNPRVIAYYYMEYVTKQVCIY